MIRWITPPTWETQPYSQLSLPPPNIHVPPHTLLGPDEITLLHWIATQHQGHGSLLELGAFLGGSTTILAQGTHHTIHSYDNFQTDYHEIIGYTLDPYQTYLQNTQPYPHIQTHKGWIEEAHWDQPIETIFIDIIKSESSATAVVNTFFPHLLPNATLIHQDYKHYYTYWIHLCMYRLRYHFQPIIDVDDSGTTVFQTIQPPDPTATQYACQFHTFTPTEIDDAFHYSQRINPMMAPNSYNEINQAHQRAKQP